MRHVLIADDEAIVRHSIALMLQALGHTYVEAGSPREATRLAAAAIAAGTPFGLLVVDYNFIGEDQDGIELVETLFARHGRLPTLMLTASTDPDVRQDALDAGVGLVLNKPVQAEPFRVALEQLLSAWADPVSS
ncbi:MAG: response regulator [Candidatus Sericytochromatia bacterium]|nr:response regulator [Candidatus Sericytochromatia bacterium]